MGERRRLTNLAYRMLGSLADAEDAVQETYARWYALRPEQRAAVELPGAWLTTVASRVCLDVLGSARARRESYVGAWLPEPLPDRAEWVAGRPGEAGVDPADRVTLDESVSMAFLVVLEEMTPAQRVAFILHDVFRYPFADVARIVGRAPEACRRLASTARRRIRDAQPDATAAQAASADQRAGVVRAFRRAWEARDIAALVDLLAPDATATGDGGGLVTAVLRPVEGAAAIARFYLERPGPAAGLAFVECTVNGQPGLAVRRGGVTVSVMAFAVAGDRIQHIWAVLNPDKLRPWGAVSAA
ncbi:RNA polymerase sigma factor SigJ [Streptomyces sp. NPDC020917]|uniref:RNA polymerase sigma factor SigJ n=1 Tax=Streptomyces sp. NPDC020917 TaxID=3365102 RepID=UPI0037B2616C